MIRGGGGQPPGSVINFDPSTLVVVMYDSPPPGLSGYLWPRGGLVERPVLVEWPVL